VTVRSRIDSARHCVRGAAAVTGALALLLAATGTARADADTAAQRPWVSLGVLTGSTQADASLADYQWETTPQMAFGAQALVGAGRFATGFRWWSAQTTQVLGLPAPTTDPSVHWNTAELVGQGRLVSVLGNQFMATASMGRMFLSYHPDHVAIDTGTGTPTVVDFKPVDEWIGGAGLGIQRPLHDSWRLGVEVEHRIFALDTAHRNGSVIETGRQSFGDWSARFEIAWLTRLR
jgi:hypothetical protein